ncbi:MAG: Rne/Rng family ribonuclease [Bradyrhizobium sp.]|uniref:Rne/Rng family ribonuclease n=1 Tax=Bradyrhizobium sp. TaxID=376 RepID=UPI0025C5AEA6|nr:ribonuclease E/G [Bradyrhizobium sp.]MBI5265119.1 Rne/Rng family ribonuclease [Bradyrhizobium sp.]
MPNKMLIDATHPEETRVVVVRGNRVEEFDFETAQRKQLRGNIYLAKVTRVEPSLQAAFVEYGGNRHGFLAFSEIHPDYYQIPVADRQALIEAEEQAHREAEEESERSNHRRRSRNRSARRRGHGERIQSEIVEGLTSEQPIDAEAHAEGGAAHSHEGEQLEAAAHDEFAPHDHFGDEHAHDHDGHDHEAHHAEAHTGERAEDAQAIEALASPPSEPVAPAEPQSAETLEPAVAEARDEAPVAGAEHGTEEDVEDEHDEEAFAEETAQSEQAADEQDEAPHDQQLADALAEDDEESDEEIEEELVESVGGDDVLEEVPERTFRPRRQYKIQEVIKRRQVMLVQVVKEERGNKGAALTSYLSLAGRYAVLMPNTARGGGISRKITSAQDRSRLKEVVQDLDVPEGMGVILRTAGASRTKPEIKRDFEYLLRLWETVRDMTLRSQAPTLVYEEGSLIKRSLRDLYNKEIDEILVAGEGGYREARDFMKMLMPTNVRAVKLYRDGQPLFSRMGVESQLDAMFSPTVQLRSGGYIVINQTEALVSIDVNSGRSTREHHIEDTALKTNLEAAEEVARQLRLRDLAGLIVIDFIDMDEKRNNRSVERKLSDCLRQDRARIQVGRISHFGLLEMSRQRIRASVLESSTEPCPQCGGTGHVRSVSSVALQLLRGLEEILMKGATHNLVVRTRTDVALYVLNHKRSHLRDLENSFKVTLSIIADQSVTGLQSYVIDRGEQVHTLEAAKALLAAQAAAGPMSTEEAFDEEEPFDIETESEVETEETEGLSDEQAAEASEGDGQQRRKRRRRRRGRAGGAREAEPREDRDDTVLREDTEPTLPEPLIAEGQEEEPVSEEDEGEEQSALARTEQLGSERRRRRGRRGGRRRRGGPEDGLAGSITDELRPSFPSEAAEAVADFDGFTAQPSPPIAEPEAASPQPTTQDQPGAEPAPAVAEESAAESEKAARRRSTVREKVSFLSSGPSEPAAPVIPSAIEPAPAPVAAPAPAAEVSNEPASESPTRPRRAGWWSRRFGGGE